jgi:ribonucleoside-diphosphate reductase alpha chain
MGFAEMCILLGISYASEEALRLANELMSFIAAEALKASVHLAEARGPFPNWKQSTYAKTLRLRNATLTSIAPTGTIGIIAGTSSGIEPLFALAYRRTNVLNQQTLTEFNPLFLRYLERRKLANNELLDAVAHYGILQEQVNVREDVRRVFITALEITPEHHVRMQAAFQKHVDNAVLPNAIQGLADFELETTAFENCRDHPRQKTSVLPQLIDVAVRPKVAKHRVLSGVNCSNHYLRGRERLSPRRSHQF